jgi:hypothetical protein
MLKISFKKVFNLQSLTNMMQITNIKALRRDQVPYPYLVRYPNCYLTERDGISHLVINVDEHEQIVVNKGQLLSPSSLERITDIVGQCGENLYRLNRYIKKRQAQWETKKPRSIRF